MANLSFTNLDFFQNKDELVSFLKQYPQFADYNFEGSNLNVLLDVLAYNTHLNNYYVHMALSEMFMDSAQRRSSLVSHAKDLNYLPRSRVRASARVDVLLNVQDEPSFIVIPKGTKFTGRCGKKTYNFYSEESVTVYPLNGVYQYTGLKISEGTPTTEYFLVDKANPVRYVIANENVDTDSLSVRVYDTNEADSEYSEFVYSADLFGVGEQDNVFYLSGFKDNQYEIYFGNGVFGKQPIHGNLIRVQYYTTVGDAANDINAFDTANNIAGYNSIVTVTKVSEGGAERESNADIRFFAPKSIQIQERAVTESDYEILLRQNFPEIQAVSVYGGELADPPQFGRVLISVDIENMDGVTAAAAKKYTDFLRTRTPIAIEPTIVAPEFMWVEVVAKVDYDTATTAMTGSDVDLLVHSAIQKYSTEKLEDFKRTFRFSRLSQYIDSADVNVISNDLKVRAIIDINPIPNFAETHYLNFGNVLWVHHTIETDTHYPAIESSEFTYNNTACFLRDDGAGKIHIMSNATGTLSYILRNVGSVDYATGEVVIQGLNVSNYVGNALKVYAHVESNDILCPVTKIIGIRSEDVTTTIVGTREN